MVGNGNRWMVIRGILVREITSEPWNCDAISSTLKPAGCRHSTAHLGNIPLCLPPTPPHIMAEIFLVSLSRSLAVWKYARTSEKNGHRLFNIYWNFHLLALNQKRAIFFSPDWDEKRFFDTNKKKLQFITLCAPTLSVWMVRKICSSVRGKGRGISKNLREQREIDGKVSKLISFFFLPMRKAFFFFVYWSWGIWRENLKVK